MTTNTTTPDSELIRMALDLCYIHGNAELGDKAMTAVHRYESRIAELEQRNREQQERIAELERGLCISFDYLIQHWDMHSIPLVDIKNAVAHILSRKDTNQ